MGEFRRTGAYTIALVICNIFSKIQSSEFDEKLAVPYTENGQFEKFLFGIASYFHASEIIIIGNFNSDKFWRTYLHVCKTHKWTKFVSIEDNNLESLHYTEQEKAIAVLMVDMNSTAQIMRQVNSNTVLLKQITWLTFLDRNDFDSNLFGDLQLSPMVRLFLVHQPIGQDFLHIVYVFTDYHSKKLKLKTFGRWKMKFGLHTSILLKDCCYNISGYGINVVYLDATPYVTAEHGSEGELVKITGIIHDTFKSILNHLGIRIKKLYQEPDSLFGGYSNKTNATGLFKHLANKDADVALCGLLMTKGRRFVADYSLSIIEVGTSVLYRRTDSSDYMPWHFKGFSLSTRLLITLSCVFLISLIKVSVRYIFKKNLDEVEILGTFGELVCQGIYLDITRLSGRTANFTFLLMGLMLSTFYGSTITSEGVVQSTTEINSLEELARNEHYRPIFWKSAAQITYIKNSNNLGYKAIWDRIKYNLDDHLVSTRAEMREQVKNHNGAIFLSSIGLMALRKILDLEGDSYKIMEGSFMKGGVHFALAKNSPLTSIMNNVILKMREGGVITRIISKYVPKQRPTKNIIQEQKEISLYNAMMPLIINGSGGLVCLLVILLEIFKQRKKSPNRLPLN